MVEKPPFHDGRFVRREVVENLPFMQVLFKGAALSPRDWIACLVPGIALLLLVEIEKAFTRSRQSRPPNGSSSL